MNRLRRLRYERGLSTRAVAEAVGVSRRTIDRFEKSDCDALPSARVAKALADYYDVSIETIWPELALAPDLDRVAA